MRGRFTVASDDQITAELLGNVIDMVELKASDLKPIHPRCRRWSCDADAHLFPVAILRNFVARPNVGCATDLSVAPGEAMPRPGRAIGRLGSPFARRRG